LKETVLIPMSEIFLSRSKVIYSACVAMVIALLGLPSGTLAPTQAAESLQARIEQEIESARAVERLEAVAAPLSAENAELLREALHHDDPLVQIVAAYTCARLGAKADLGEAITGSLRSLSGDEKQHPRLRAMCLLAEKQVELRNAPAEKRLFAMRELLAPDEEFQRSALRPMYCIVQEGNIPASLQALYPESFDTQNSIGIYYALKRKWSGNSPGDVASLIDILKTEHDTNPGRCLAAIACLIDIGPRAVTALLGELSANTISSDNFFFYSYAVEVCKGVSDPQALPLLRTLADMPTRKDITGNGWIPFSYLQHRARIAIRWIEGQTPYPYKYRNIFGWEKRERVGR
jgi:hypothetical protein